MEGSRLKKNQQVENYLLRHTKPLNTKEACQYLGIARSSLYKLTHKNKLAFSKPNGKMNYFLRSDLDAYMLKGRRKSNDELEQQAINHVMFGRDK